MISQDCCICLSELDPSLNPLATLLCGHIFHHECISKVYSLGRNRMQSCPVCRTPINKAPIKLFLSGGAAHSSTSTDENIPSISIVPANDNANNNRVYNIDEESENEYYDDDYEDEEDEEDDFLVEQMQQRQVNRNNIDLEGLLENLQHQITDLCREKAALTSRCRRLRTDYEEECQLNARLKEEETVYKQQIAELRKKIQAMEVERADMRIRDRAEARMQTKMHSEMNVLQSERDAARKEATMFQFQMVQLQNELANVRSIKITSELQDVLRHVRDETVEEYVEALRLKEKEELVSTVQIALYQSHQDRKRVEQLEAKYRELAIEHERLQRNSSASSATSASHIRKPSLRINPIEIDDDDDEKEQLRQRPPVKTRRPLLPANVPVIRRTTNTSSGSSNGQYVPDGRGGQSKVLVDRNGRMHLF